MDYFSGGVKYQRDGDACKTCQVAVMPAMDSRESGNDSLSSACVALTAYVCISGGRKDSAGGTIG